MPEPAWLKEIWDKRKLFYQKHLDNGIGSEFVGEFQVPDEVETEDLANLRSSWLGDDKHAPALDLDIGHQYVPSTTEGHGHLYLDVELTATEYKELLDVLLKCKIIQPGFHAQFGAGGATFLRTRKKGEKPPAQGWKHKLINAGMGKKQKQQLAAIESKIMELEAENGAPITPEMVDKAQQQAVAQPTTATNFTANDWKTFATTQIDPFTPNPIPPQWKEPVAQWDPEEAQEVTWPAEFLPEDTTSDEVVEWKFDSES